MPIVVTVPKSEVYDEENDIFYEIKNEVTLVMEHNLIAISRWESKFHKPYLTKDTKTNEEILYYLECMTITKGVESYVYRCIPKSELLRITEYINDPMTGTTVRESPYAKKQGKEEIQSAELLYYYMFKLGIPKECENWHLNRLMTLMKVYGAKDEKPDGKASRSELIARNRAINARNRSKYHSKG